jgi:hypothetical protein
MHALRTRNTCSTASVLGLLVPVRTSSAAPMMSVSAQHGPCACTVPGRDRREQQGDSTELNRAWLLHVYSVPHWAPAGQRQPTLPCNHGLSVSRHTVERAYTRTVCAVVARQTVWPVRAGQQPRHWRCCGCRPRGASVGVHEHVDVGLCKQDAPEQVVATTDVTTGCGGQVGQYLGGLRRRQGGEKRGRREETFKPELQLHQRICHHHVIYHSDTITHLHITRHFR